MGRPAGGNGPRGTTVSSHASPELRTFFPIALAMLEPGAVIPGELWLRHRSDQEPVLSRTRDLQFTHDHRVRLLDAGCETLLVPFSDSSRWTGYLESRLRERILDSGRPMEARAEVLVTTARSIMKEVLSSPDAPETRERVGNLADSICDLMRQPSALATTVRLMEHDYYTYTHSLHVSIYSVALARELGIEDVGTLAEVARGTLMHDCGKCKVPLALINKAGRFTLDEWETMKRHPSFGVQVMQETGWPAGPCEEIVRSHHERMDGSGYPDGLVGRGIPLAARITAICDAFDAMTTDRAYQRARRGIQALRVIRVDDRQRYDQALVEKFIRLMAANNG